jgi:O-methyltransferase
MWRAHIVNTCINWVQDVEGDIVELGTWYGILAQTILQNDNLSREKKLFLVDAFGQPGFKMSGRHKLNSYQVDIFDVVQERFKKSAQVHLVRGIVPEVLRNIPTNKVCFLMIDMNSGIPEQKGLEFFWDKLTVGAIVYFDDYGQNFPELRQLIDEFLVGKKEKLLVFPTGQAILQKM